MYKVRGYSFGTFVQYVRDSVTALSEDSRISNQLLGGWSNLNFFIQSAKGKFVLKIPVKIESFTDNPYQRLVSLYNEFSLCGLSPRPIECGRLDDDWNTPFLLLEYVNGRVYRSPREIPSFHLLMLKESLSRFRQVPVKNCPSFRTPIDLLEHVFQKPLLGRNFTKDVADIYQEVLHSIPQIYALYEDIEWTGGLMHGDLAESNVIFTTNGVIFLDLESVALGDSAYDLAYFLVQHQECIQPCPTELVSTAEDLHKVQNLYPLALVSVIGWSLLRLLEIDSGVLEPIFSTADFRSKVLVYTRQKLSVLKKLLKGHTTV